MQTITSIKEPLIVEARELSAAAGRAHSGKCLLEGAEILGWALDAAVALERVFCVPAFKDAALLARLEAVGCPVFSVSEGIQKKITDTNYVVPIVGVARMPAEPGPEDGLGDFALVLDGVRDFGNIGTIVRTARAFGVRDLISTSRPFDLYYRKTIEASRGTVFGMKVRRCDSPLETVAFLKQRGFQVVATSSHAPLVQNAVQLQPRPVALVVGNETQGISDELLQAADWVVQIPMSGPVESLNVGVATGISLYEFKFKAVLAMLIKYIRATLGRQVNVTSKYIQQAFDVRLRQVCPLDSRQVIFLMVLKCDEMMTMEQAGRDLGAFGDELTGLLQPLFVGGYIDHVEGRHDVLQLTEAGEALLGRLWSVVEAAEAEVLAGFSERERQQLGDYLQRIQENCAKISSQQK